MKVRYCFNTLIKKRVERKIALEKLYIIKITRNEYLA